MRDLGRVGPQADRDRQQREHLHPPAQPERSLAEDLYVVIGEADDATGDRRIEHAHRRRAVCRQRQKRDRKGDQDQ